MVTRGRIDPEANAFGKAEGYADGVTVDQMVEVPRSGSIMSASETIAQEWRDIDWPTVESHVHTLQRRIYRASQKGDGRSVHRLQRLLMSSRTAKLLAVRRVTQDNQGKRTAGVDGVASLEPEERLQLVDQLRLDARPQPVRRVWIPKPGSDEMRPLGIPTMHDRALQSLVKLALEPEWEAKFEPNSYGFRPGRSCHDAIEAIFICIKGRAKYVLDADIAKCFDRINHESLLNKLDTFPLMRRVIKAWLEAGVLDGETLFPTEQGTPQGGVISPLLANIALHGLEREIESHFTEYKSLGTGKGSTRWRPTVIRYADDFVVLHQDQQVVEQCKAIAQEWLKGMGLELKPSKTRIAHTFQEVEGEAGFDFLGFTIRQFPVGKYRSARNGSGAALGFKTIIKPSKKKVKLHQERLADIVKRLRSAPQKVLIKSLNPVIKGWCNYYRTVCSARRFQLIDAVLHNLLMRWAKWRHRSKGSQWVVRKYWQLPEWIFGPKEGVPLLTHSKTKIVRHVKVRGDKTPFDGDWKYWASRQAYYPGVTPWLAMLLKSQKGKCACCGMIFMPEDLLEVHHVYLDADRKNFRLEALHRHCHDKVHGPGRKAVELEESVHDED
jgi:RNA-directed DNA polymerase